MEEQKGAPGGVGVSGSLHCPREQPVSNLPLLQSSLCLDVFWVVLDFTSSASKKLVDEY